MTWGSTSWGAWHTGPDVSGPCPQDGRWHSLDEATNLNEKEREYKRAYLYESMRRWRKEEK